MRSAPSRSSPPKAEVFDFRSDYRLSERRLDSVIAGAAAVSEMPSPWSLGRSSARSDGR